MSPTQLDQPATVGTKSGTPGLAKDVPGPQKGSFGPKRGLLGAPGVGPTRGSWDQIRPLEAGVSGNSRSRPFPGIPASHSRSRKLGMIFSFQFPKVGNAILHSRSRSQNLGMQLSVPVTVTGNGLSKSGIRTGIKFKRWEKEGF